MKNKKDNTTLMVSKNMAKAIRIIKNTEEYRNINEVFNDPNFSELLRKALTIVNSTQEEKQNGTTSNASTEQPKSV